MLSKSLVFISGILAALIMPLAAAQAADTPPDVLAKSVTDEVMQILRTDKEVQNNQSKTVALVDAKILPHFDFSQMTQLPMGRHWRDASPEQRKRNYGAVPDFAGAHVFHRALDLQESDCHVQTDPPCRRRYPHECARQHRAARRAARSAWICAWKSSRTAGRSTTWQSRM